MSTKAEVWQGTLALMVLKTLHAMGPQHGYGIARRIEQTSDNLLSINHGTLYYYWVTKATFSCRIVLWDHASPRQAHKRNASRPI